MPLSVQAELGKNQIYSVRIAEVLNEVLILQGVKAGWVAHVAGIPDSVLSEMRRGTRRIPAGLVPVLDQCFSGSPLLEELARMEGRGTFPLDPSSMSAEDLKQIFLLHLREEGAANSIIAEALLDGVLDDQERQTIHAKATKLRRLWAEIEERTAPARS